MWYMGYGGLEFAALNVLMLGCTHPCLLALGDLDMWLLRMFARLRCTLFSLPDTEKNFGLWPFAIVLRDNEWSVECRVLFFNRNRSC